MADEELKARVRALAQERTKLKISQDAAAVPRIREIRKTLREIDPDRSIESELRGEKLRPYPA